MIGIKQTNDILNAAKIPMIKNIPDIDNLIYIFVPIAGILNKTCNVPTIKKAFLDAGYNAEFLEQKTAAINPNNPYRVHGCKWLAFRLNTKEG